MQNENVSKTHRKSKLVTLDFETDPFQHGAIIAPFVWDIFDGASHVTYWGDDCTEQLIEYLRSHTSKLIIYAHNGGKFDFMFLLRWIRGNKMLVVNNRIVEAELSGHIIRDSFAAIPVPLRAMEKDDIDYEKMRKSKRNKYRDEIIRYLYKDTESLYKYVAAYREMFGVNAKTMASAAIKELKKFHTYDVMGETNDTVFREYFHGGRVECFRTGIVKMPLKIFDVNSMYPSVMKNFLHPISAVPLPGSKIHPKTYFVEWFGESLGAMPQKDKQGSLRFPHAIGSWKCSIHEFIAGIETGTIKVERVLKTWEFLERASFAEFIDTFYDRRMSAKQNNDAVNTLFFKLVMNSAYGKFAQNPRDFCDYIFTNSNEDGPDKQCWCETAPHCGCGGWRMATEPCDGWQLWKRPAQKKIFGGWHNVATAASITGAARSLLLRAIVSSDSPVYCDTDSLICRDMGAAIKIDSQELGAWKLEQTGDRIAIAGKKMYSVWSGREVVKTACKGVRLTADEIASVASGEEVEYANIAPTIKFSGKQIYITRRVRRTA